MIDTVEETFDYLAYYLLAYLTGPILSARFAAGPGHCWLDPLITQLETLGGAS
jgi:hypothetical protein